MLQYYIRRGKSEDFQKVGTPPKGDVWIHGDAVSEKDLHALAEAYGFNYNILNDILDKNELPRVEQRDDALYVFVRTARRSKRGRVTTTPVLLAVRGSVFINISTAATEDHALATPSVIAQASDTTSLLLGTFAAVVNEYEELVQRISRYITDTEQRLRTHEVTNEDFIRFVTVENNLNEYLTSLNGMQVVAERLREHMPNNGDHEAIEDILLYIRQLIVAIASHNQSITSIRNAYGTIANNVLNQRMKTLTMLTLLVALPNVFYGMYGMNVVLPFQDAPWAYTAVVGFTVLLLGCIFLVARRLKWF